MESSIAEKRKALKKLTNKEDYEAAMKVIEAEEKKLETITERKTRTVAGMLPTIRMLFPMPACVHNVSWRMPVSP